MGDNSQRKTLGTVLTVLLTFALVTTLTPLMLADTASAEAGEDPETTLKTAEDRIDPYLADLLTEMDEGDLLLVAVQLEQWPEAGIDGLSTFFEARGIQGGWTMATLPAMWTFLTADQVRELAEDPAIAYLEADRPIEFNLETTTREIGAESGRTPGVFDNPDLEFDGLPVDGSTTNVAVLDTGIDTTHPDLPLGSKVTENLGQAHLFYACASFNPVQLILDGDRIPPDCPVAPQEFVPAITAIDQIQSPISDTHSHGTHVASTVAGLGEANPNFKGVAPGAKLIGLAAGDTATFAMGVNGLQWLVLNHDRYDIDIVTNSWGTLGGSEHCPECLHTQLIEQLLDEEVTLIWATGNDGHDDPSANGGQGEMTAHARICGVIGVGNYDDANLRMATSSSGGISDWDVEGTCDLSTGDRAPVHRPTVAAPGTNNAARHIIGQSNFLDQIGPRLSGITDYVILSGTSMATPHVAGTVALMEDAVEKKCDEDLSPWENHQIVQATARPILLEDNGNPLPASQETDPDSDTFRPDHIAGAGAVDTYRAVQAALAYKCDGEASTLDRSSLRTATSEDAFPNIFEEIEMGALNVFQGTLFDPARPQGTFTPAQPLSFVAQDMHEREGSSCTVDASTQGRFVVQRDDTPQVLEFIPANNEADGANRDFRATWDVPADMPPGEYSVFFETDACGASFERTPQLRAFRMQTGPPPVSGDVTAEFSHSPQNPLIDDAVTFTDASESTYSEIESWEWEFGDGATATGQGPHDHAYSQAGLFEVTLTVTDKDGATASKTDTVLVGSQPPTIDSFTADPSSLNFQDNEPVTFTTVASDPDGQPLEYNVTFGDGTWTGFQSSNTVDHTYTEFGEFTAMVEVRDPDGAMATETTTVAINNVRNDDGDTLHPTIQSAVDAANPGDTILVGPGQYDENVNAPVAVHLCSSLDLTACDGSPSDVTLNGTGAGSVLSLPGGSVAGFTVTSGPAMAPVNGVHLRGTVQVTDNAIEMPVGGQDPVNGGYPLQVRGILSQGGDGSVIQDNTITAPLVDTEEDTLGGTNGIEGALLNAEIRGNTFSGWQGNAIFLYSSSTGALVDANAFSQGGTGVLVCSPSEATVRANTYDEMLIGVDVCQGAEGTVVRDNTFPLTVSTALRVQGTEPLTVDARSNDWSLYTWRLLPARVQQDNAQATVLQLPYLDTDGEPEPGQVTNQDTGETFLSIQEAVDAAGVGDTLVAQASDHPQDPTPWRESVTIATEGITLCSTPHDGAACQPSPDTALIDATGIATSTVTVRAEDVTVTGFTLRQATQDSRTVDARGSTGFLLEDNHVETGALVGPSLKTAAALSTDQDAAYYEDPFVLDAYQGGAIATVEARYSDEPGFHGAVAVPEGQGYIAALFQGPVPEGVTAQPATESLPAIEPIGEVTFERAMREVSIVEDPALASDSPEGPQPPAPSQNIGPGTAMVLDFGSVRAGCTANWVYQDTSGSYYLGAAGHCFLVDPDAGLLGDGFPNTNHPDWIEPTVFVCVEACDTDTFHANQLVELGEIPYAQQQDASGNQVGHDFGVVEIPEEHLDLVRPWLWQWDGPRSAEGADRPLIGDVALQYGHGLGMGEAFPTEGRGGLFSPTTTGAGCSGEGCTVRYLGPSISGDSGSPIGLFDAFRTTADLEQGPTAVGILTHLSIGVRLDVPTNTAGTHIQRAFEIMDQGAGLQLDLVTADEPIQLPLPDPPTGLTATNLGTGESLALAWSGTEDTYRVYRSIGSSTFGDKAAVADVTEESYTDTGLTEDTTYCYQVVAVASDGTETAPTAEACATTTVATLPPPPPGYVRTEDPERGDRLTVVWGEPAHQRAIDHYRVERSADGGTSWTLLAADKEERFHLDEGLTEGTTYQYRVTAIDELGLASDPTAPVSATPTTSDLAWTQLRRTADGQGATGATGEIPLPGLAASLSLDGPVTSSPLVADLDGDGALDVLVVQDTDTPDGRVIARAFTFDGDGLTELWSTPITPNLLGEGVPPTNGFGSAAIGDLDKDGTPEVAVYTNYIDNLGAVTANDGSLTLLDGATGTTLGDDGGVITIGTQSHPRIGDVLDTPGDEVVILQQVGGTDPGYYLNIYSWDGNQFTSEVNELVTATTSQASPVLVEARADHPGLEVAIASGSSSNTAGTVFLCEPAGDDANCQTVADLPTGIVEMAATTLEATKAPSLALHGRSGDALMIQALSEDGTSTQLPTDTLWSHPSAADLDDDGLTDVVSALNNELEEETDPSGDVLFHGRTAAGLDLKATHERPAPLAGSSFVPGGTVVADIDGDGSLDVLAADQNGTLAAIDPDLAGSGPFPLWTLGLDGPVSAPVALGDIDGDDALEVLVATEGGTLHVVDTFEPVLPDLPIHIGVHLAGNHDAHILGNEVTVAGAFCSTEDDGFCEKPFVTGIWAGSGDLIEENVISAEPLNSEDQELLATWGINANARDVTILGNEIRGFASAGVAVWQPGVSVEGNLFEANLRGVHVANADVEILGNDLLANSAGIYFAGGPDLAAEQALVRENSFGLTNPTAVLIEADKTGKTFDLRLNEWGVYDHRLLEERIQDNGVDNELLLVPFIDADGEAEPPLIRRHHEGQNDLQSFLSIQEAIDAPDAQGSIIIVPGGTLTDEGVRKPARTPYMESVVIDAPGVSLCGVPVTASEFNFCWPSFNTATHATVDATGQGGPAITVAADDVRVSGLNLEGASPLFEATGVAGLLVQHNGLDQVKDASSATHGIQLSAADGARVSGNQLSGNMYPGSIAIEAADTAEARVDNNTVRGAGTGIYVSGATDASIASNTVDVPPVSQFAGESLGISLFDGSGHALEANLVQGAGVGLTVSGTTEVTSELDAFRATPTGVRIAGLTGAQGQDDVEIHNATLATAGTALLLDDDTSDLFVDAECNDWGVYNGLLIPSRLQDDGQDNTVDFEPFIGIEGQGLDCLVPPTADFRVEDGDGDGTFTRLDELQFISEAEAGSKPIAVHDWRFGDGAQSFEEDPTHQYGEVGAFTATLEVTDADGMSRRAAQTLSIENLDPVLDPIDPITVQHGEQITFEVTATDPEEDPITLTATGDPLANNDATFTDHGDGTGTFTWTTDAFDGGSFTVDLTAQDDLGGIDTQTVGLTVINQAPVFDPSVPETVGGNEEILIEVDVLATDPDGDAVDLAAAGVPLSDLGATFTQTGDGLGTFAWTPSVGDAGPYTVDFTATSAGDLSTVKTVEINVGDFNTPPTLDITGPDEVLPPSDVTLDLTATDGDSHRVNFTVQTVPPLPLDTLDQDPSAKTATWTAHIPGGFNEDIQVTVTAEDGINTVQATHDLRVLEPPRVDVLTPIEVTSGALADELIVGEEVTLRATARDGDGSIASGQFFLGSVEAGTALTTTQATGALFEASFTPTTLGTVEISFEAIDDTQLSGADARLFEVVENTPPSVDAGADQTEDVGEDGTVTFTVTGSASDPDGRGIDGSSFTWHLPTALGGGQLTGQSVDITLPVGSWDIVLEVEDVNGAVGQDTVTLGVDDTIEASATMLQATQETEDGVFVYNPTTTVGDTLESRVSVLRDNGVGAADAVVTGNLTYYGTSDKLVSLAQGSAEATTDADGEAVLALNQTLSVDGVLQDIASLPGYYELEITVEADSRAQGAVQDVETASELLRIWIGPAPLGQTL